MDHAAASTDHHGGCDSLNTKEPQPKPKPPFEQHSSTDRLAPQALAPGRSSGVVMMPDGSIVSVHRSAPSQQRSDVSSVERPYNQAPSHATSGATAGPVFNSVQEEPLPFKQSIVSGPAPGSEPPVHYPPHMHAVVQHSYHINEHPYNAGEGIPPKPDQLRGAPGPAPEPGGRYLQPSQQVPPSQQQPPLPNKEGAASHAPVPGRAPDHVPPKPGASAAGPAPDAYRQVPVVQRTQPQPASVLSYQPFPQYQYQPYQPPVQLTTPYTVYQQPAATTQSQKPLKTSKVFSAKTVDDNQYYISLCLCITLTLLCNPLTLICCIPAFWFASKAADENMKNNYEKALENHRRAQYLNAGGFIFIVMGGVLLPIVVTIIATVAAVLTRASSSI